MTHCKYRVMDKCKKSGDMCFNEYIEPEEEKKPTNADRIRSMSDEELAEFAIIRSKFFCDKRGAVCNKDGSCVDCALKWLQAERQG